MGAINATFSAGFSYGIGIGAITGLLLYLAQREVSARFRIRKVKTYAMAGSVIGISLVVGVVSAIVAMVIRILSS